eukprot:6469007-Amphidinium_carterae.1
MQPQDTSVYSFQAEEADLSVLVHRLTAPNLQSGAAIANMTVDDDDTLDTPPALTGRIFWTLLRRKYSGKRLVP